MDTFLTNVQGSEILGEFKGDQSLDKITGSLGGADDSKVHQEWTKVLHDRYISLQSGSDSSSSNNSTVSSNDQETLSTIRWCDDLVDDQEFIKTIKKRSVAIHKIMQDLWVSEPDMSLYYCL